jgi:hypothetical protein
MVPFRLTYVYTPFHGSLYLHFAVFSDGLVIRNITTFRNIRPTINLANDAILVQLRRYRLNLNYAARVKEEIDKLLQVSFIRPAKRATWLSPIVVVPKKNDKLVCVDYRKLNAAVRPS